MAIGTAYVQGEDVAARGRVLLFSFSKNENPQNLVLDGSIVNSLMKSILIFKLPLCLSGNLSILVSGYGSLLKRE